MRILDCGLNLHLRKGTAIMAQPAITIRDIELIREMRAVEELQKEVWQFDDRDVVPLTMLIATIEVGGILVGAFDGDTLIGFAYGFTGYERGRVIIHSDMLAVKPEYRNRSLGYRLKLAQRERAMAKGITSMTWTFDPLQSRNAHLNFSKLGVVADRYLVNFYGEETSSFLHRHTGTDRLWVHWPLNSARVRRRLEREQETEDFPYELKRILPLVRLGVDGAPDASKPPEKFTQEYALIEIPSEVSSLRQQNPALAAQWREATRGAFSGALAAGYLVQEFYRSTRDGQSCGVYLLSLGKRVEDFGE